MKEVFVLVVYLLSNDGTYTDKTYPNPTLFMTKEACKTHADSRNAYDGMADYHMIQRAIKDGRRSLEKIPSQMVFGCGTVRMFEDNVKR